MTLKTNGNVNVVVLLMPFKGLTAKLSDKSHEVL